MGEVWRARDTRLAREVALKVLPESVSRDRERLQRFEREAQVLASLNHPGRARRLLDAVGRVGDKAAIHVGSLDKPGATVITPSDSRAEYANGYLFYVLQGTLVARRFDPDKLVAAGERLGSRDRTSTLRSRPTARGWRMASPRNRERRTSGCAI